MHIKLIKLLNGWKQSQPQDVTSAPPDSVDDDVADNAATVDNCENNEDHGGPSNIKNG